MKTTFEKIKKFNPCEEGWKKLCELNPEMDMKKEISILEILNHNGLEHAYWALRTQKEKVCKLIIADILESISNIHIPKTSIYFDFLIASKFTNKNVILIASRAALIAAEAAKTAYNQSIFDSLIASKFTNKEDIPLLSRVDNNVFENAYRAQWKKNEEILRKYLEDKNE